jgi:BirA family biotin operon repressor/biotin-[acetyl-CoA-carboxylase] ligase
MLLPIGYAHYPTDVGQSESKETRSALSQSLIQQELKRLGVPDVELHVFDKVGSTNEDITQYLSAVESKAAVVVTADEQIAGRGRLDRTWSSPWAAGIAMSVGVHISTVAGQLSSVPLRAGLAVNKALTELGVSSQLKWPNDVVTYDGHKIGGLLSFTRDGRVVVGIGLNVSLTESELPTPTSTSLQLLGHDLEREVLIAAIVQQLLQEFTQDNWLDDYNRASATLGKKVRLQRINLPDVEGIVSGFLSDGSISIETLDGVSAFSMGDVEHLRPAE